MHTIFKSLLLSMIFIFLMYTLSSAQETKSFGKKGVTETGGSLAFSSMKYVYNGRAGDSYNLFQVSGYVGYFIADGFELGANPLSIIGGNGAMQMSLNFAPSYHFLGNSRVAPFVEGIAGLTFATGRNALNYGFRAGLKNVISNDVVIISSVQYLVSSFSEEKYAFGETRQFLFSIGITLW
jgi:hypothetical protein